MRCFIPATDDDLYAYIERYGIQALVPYRVGMNVARSGDIQALSAPVDHTAVIPVQEPRLAA